MARTSKQRGRVHAQSKCCPTGRGLPGRSRPQRITDDLDRLLEVLPERVGEALASPLQP